MYQEFGPLSGIHQPLPAPDGLGQDGLCLACQAKEADIVSSATGPSWADVRALGPPFWGWGLFLGGLHPKLLAALIKNSLYLWSPQIT